MRTARVEKPLAIKDKSEASVLNSLIKMNTRAVTEVKSGKTIIWLTRRPE
jgi:hypothetical protein